MLLREEWNAPNVGTITAAVAIGVSIFLIAIVGLSYGIAIPIACVLAIVVGLVIESRWRKANPEAAERAAWPRSRRR